MWCYTPPEGKLRSKKIISMTSLGNWVKHYSWSSYQKKAQEKMCSSHWAASCSVWTLSGVRWRSCFFCPNKWVEFSLSQHHTWRARPWTGLTVQQTSKAVGLASKPWEDEKSPKPKYEGCFFVCLVFLTAALDHSGKRQLPSLPNTEAALFNWNLTFSNQIIPQL